MPRWDLFAGAAFFLVAAMLALSYATQRGVAADPEASFAEALDPATLAANVALTHGLLGGLLLAAAWYSRVPASALGLATHELAAGVGLGVALFLANEAAERLLDLSGVEYDERLRELLAPDSATGWAVLLLFVLPVVAGAEELLFRGALIGALAAGYGLSPWLLAAVSSALFGLGHGLQGPGGILVTAVLGLVLAAGFVLTGSLLAVIVAHYLVNALEFTTHHRF